MGFFRRNAGEEKGHPTLAFAACLTGRVIPMEQIPDPAFAEGLLGPCIGIEPPAGAERCEITAPADGRVIQCSDTGHAVGLACGDTELLIHAGIDTVALGGAGFVLSVSPGDTVRRGQALLVMDAAAVRRAGYAAVVVTVVTETSGQTVFSRGTETAAGETLFAIHFPGTPDRER